MEATPFASSLEHVLAEVERMALRLRLFVRWAREQKQHDPRYEGLFISEEEVESLLTTGGSMPAWSAPPTDLWAEVAGQALASVEATLAARKAVSTGLGLRLDKLESWFGLTPFERDVLLLGLLPEVDPRFERVMGYLQDDVTRRRLSVDLALNVLMPSAEHKIAARSAFAADGALLQKGLLVFADAPARPPASLSTRTFAIDARIAAFLLGDDGLDPVLAGLLRVAERQADPAPEAVALAGRLRALVADAPGATCSFHLRGPEGAGRTTIAAATAAGLGRELVIFDVGSAVRERAADFAMLATRAAREAVLRGAALYCHDVDVLLEPERRPARRALEGALRGRVGLTFLAGEQEWGPLEATGALGALPIDVPCLDRNGRIAAWERALGPAASPDVLAGLPNLATGFRLTPLEVVAAAAAARNVASSRGGAAGVTSADLRSACRALFRGRLGAVARRVTPKATMGDLVLDADVRSQLEEIVIRTRFRARVLEDFGFEAKLSRGRGLGVLFAGPSGTGKTMAAEAIAREVDLDLYAIDLSSVVSKYIGETEKNLSGIFAAAESTGAILFFDEADALFGKRSETKDAHDRYANLETAYLLQRMEEYEGTTILATNLRRNMDDAFVRRIAVAVTFALPEEAERLSIWRSVFPAATPVGEDVDLAVLARRFRLSGGNIKNVALGAAFRAAASGGPVRMADLLAATKDELRKMGKTWDDGEVEVR